MLDVETLHRGDDGFFPEPDGELIEVLDYVLPSGKLRVLTRPDGERGEVAEKGRKDSTSEGKPYQCVETKSDDSRCTREVDEPGGLCWQHEDDE